MRLRGEAFDLEEAEMGLLAFACESTPTVASVLTRPWGCAGMPTG